MEGFLNWFFVFISAMLQGVRQTVVGMFSGIAQIFDLPSHLKQFSRYSQSFGMLDWILSVFAALLVLAMWAALFVLLVTAVLRYFRFRRERLRRDELLNEVDDLRRELRHMTQEHADLLERLAETSASTTPAPPAPELPERFHRLCAIDHQYRNYIPPSRPCDMSLRELCDAFRNFAASRLGLYYNREVVRLFFAGLASSRLIILQGISGTGKTSLPYALGKFFENDATIAPVQPSWHERADMLGYLNEFTHTFHETEVLQRLYEATYRDDLNLIVLDEMNIARVEYYFADMLSLLELPNPDEWKLDILTAVAENDPEHLICGKLTVPRNIRFIGTVNHDESTYAIADKVYDRAITIHLNAKGIAFDAPDTPPTPVSYRDLEALFDAACQTHPVSERILADIELLDSYLADRFGISFGNRILKHLSTFVPVFVACGGEALDAVDYLLMSKVLRKLDALDLSLRRAELRDLIDYFNRLFGTGSMRACLAYLEQKTQRG